MGIKRPLEEEDPEPSFHQPKQPDCNKKLAICTEESYITTAGVDSPGGAKGTSCKLQFDGRLEDGERDGASIGDKELEASAPLSLVTSSSSEEDAGNRDTSLRSYFPEYIDYSLPMPLPEQFEDPYIYLLNSSPRKEVPIGPDHQAEVPLWNPNVGWEDFSNSNFLADNNRDQKLLGTCIIPMPDFNDSNIDGVRAGRGRTDCSCLDVGSMRCVQQHVKEVRERLRETVGDEKFKELGFCDMGDEVACKWTPDDEQIFLEVVLSNPASHGRKFWKHLREAFPTRTKKELVSYYFNVFMLHRRAVQNRSYMEIDSDNDEERRSAHGDFHQNGSYSFDLDTDHDDERQVPNRECYLIGGDDEDSTVESFGDQELDASWVDNFWSEPENIPMDDGSNRKHGNPERKVEKQNDIKIDDKTEETAGQETKKLDNDRIFGS
ncbi:hypothetical protein CDL12_05355 [Handroanthus impetiginosus]|uniref:SANT domain-containing protein n=1 Tax=Handroanthus impetiginosus TaxID=429701 RepID=A0A2G9HWP6_9LAMI|nr:hypothetical protein CDL12_05355 [Handroanthus impetiginosus]